MWSKWTEIAKILTTKKDDHIRSHLIYSAFSHFLLFNDFRYNA